MAKSSAMEIMWEKVEVLGKECLFTCARVDKETVPEGYYMYEVRHDDECLGNPVEIATSIFVNHWGTILSKEPFELEPKRDTGIMYRCIDSEEDWNYLGSSVTLG